jgi:hypothetical protein
VAQVPEFLPSQHEAQSSNLHNAKKKKKTELHPSQQGSKHKYHLNSSICDCTPEQNRVHHCVTTPAPLFYKSHAPPTHTKMVSLIPPAEMVLLCCFLTSLHSVHKMGTRTLALNSQICQILPLLLNTTAQGK